MSETYTALMPGDCLELLPLIPDNSIDMVLADPPYGTTQCKWDSIIPLDRMWPELERVAKPRAAIVMTAAQPFTSALIMSNIRLFKYCWVWDKKLGGNPLNAKIMPLKTVEDVCVFGVGRINYFPIMRTGPLRTKGGSKKQPAHTGKFNTEHTTRNDQYYPTSVIVESNATRRKGRVHPTQKPVALMEYLIKTYTNPGAVVLDFTMGSGTTGIACKKLGRSFVGMEKDPGYFKIAQERINSVDGLDNNY